MNFLKKLFTPKEYPLYYIKFKCDSCDEWHYDPPGFGFAEPFTYVGLSQDEKNDPDTLLTDDLCVVLDEYFFIKAFLILPIIGTEDVVNFSVWVSQSRTNFQYYADNFSKDLLGRETFGYLNSSVPGYADTINLECRVVFQTSNKRPTLHFLHQDHQLAIEHSSGITIERALEFKRLFENNMKK